MEVVISKPRRGNAAILEKDANHVRVRKIRWRKQRERVDVYSSKVAKSMCAQRTTAAAAKLRDN